MHGVPIVQVIDPRLKTSTVGLWFKAGYRFDASYPAGTAHCFEHLLMHQTAGHKDPIDRFLSLESRGIDSGASTNLEMAIYHQTQRPEQTEVSLDLLIRDWQESTFSKHALDKERSVIRNEMADRHDDLSTVIYDQLRTSLFPEHPLGFPVLGTADSLEHISKKTLESFYADRYTPDHLAISVFAPRKLDCSAVLLKRGIESLSREREESQPVILPPIAATSLVYEGGRSAIGVGFRTVPVTGNLQDRVALDILKNCLANCWSSLLIQRLRQKRGFIYWADASTSYMLEGGMFTLFVQCSKENLSLVEEELYVVVDEIRQGRLDDGIFVAAKEIYMTAIAEEVFEPEWILDEQMNAELLGVQPDDPEEYLYCAQQTTIEDMQRVAQQYLLVENAAIVKTR